LGKRNSLDKFKNAQMKALSDEVENKRLETSQSRAQIKESIRRNCNELKSNKLIHAKALREALQSSVADAR
jgi:hypothetical protein